MQQPHGQRLPLDHHAVRIGHALRHLLSESIQITGIDHPGIPEPTTIRRNSAGGRRDGRVAGAIAHHELAPDHLALLVADGLAVVVHFETGDGGGGAGVGVGGGGYAVLFGGGGGFDEHVASVLGRGLLGVFVARLDHLERG